ncbi:Hpt domain-containing protein, partial [Cohnella xylanilytica]
MDDGMSEYLGIFLDELEEQLQILDERLLLLERDPADSGTIGIVFRAAHTLKGSSAAMGFGRIKELTHQMENLFELMRSGRLAPNASLMNALFRSVDEIKTMKAAIQAGEGDEGRDIRDLLRQLADHAREAADAEEREPRKPAADEGEPAPDEGELVLDGFHRKAIYHAWDQKLNALRVLIRFASDESFAYARALVVHRTLEEMGEVIASFPS